MAKNSPDGNGHGGRNNLQAQQRAQFNKNSQKTSVDSYEVTSWRYSHASTTLLLLLKTTAT